MLGLDVVGNASIYTLVVLCALAADNLDNLCFVDFPAHHGYAALDALYPKHVNGGHQGCSCWHFQHGRGRAWRRGDAREVVRDGVPFSVNSIREKAGDE